eukprot:m.432616 g.432616  ORF g.432616 m.432616 type:complete len:82 (+) comp17466_c0_seq1:69-314(+)
MAITTIAYFTAGGLFTAVYSNAVRRFPVFRKPQLHVVCTAVGAAIGYQAHLYEEWARVESVQIDERRVAKSTQFMQKLETN